VVGAKVERVVPLAKRSNLDLLLAEDVSFECAVGIIADRQLCSRAAAANSTVDALMYGLRAGVKALERGDVQRRITALDEPRMHDCAKALQQRRAKPWSKDEIRMFVAMWVECHDRR